MMRLCPRRHGRRGVAVLRSDRVIPRPLVPYVLSLLAVFLSTTLESLKIVLLLDSTPLLWL